MAISVGRQAPTLVHDQQHVALFLYSHAAAVMAIAGAVSFVASVFFGYNCFYPVTVTGLCFCAWAGTVHSQTPQQAAWNQKFRDELLRLLARAVRTYLDSVLEAPATARQEGGHPIGSSQSAKDGAVFPPKNPIQRLGACLGSVPEWVEARPCAEWVEIKRGASVKWVEVKRWPPVARCMTPSGPEVDPVLTDEIVVQAFTNGIDLKYVTLNLQTRGIQSGDILMLDSLEETIEFLKNCFVILEGNKYSPVFSLSCHTFSGTYHGKFAKRYGSQTRISTTPQTLTLRADLLLGSVWCVWSIFNTNSQRVICTNCVSLSGKCSAAAIKFFKRKGLYHLDQSSRSHWTGGHIQFVKEELVLDKILPDRLFFKPIHHASGFGAQILVSKFMWAITLIRHKGISGNHAQIIIEGINDGCFTEIPIGRYFVYLTDLMGANEIVEITTGEGVRKEVREAGSSMNKLRDAMMSGKVEKVREFRVIRTDLKTEFNIKYEGRSETWKRPSSSVKDMIRTIVKERDDPPPGFSILGRHSIFASGDGVRESCITWAIGKLNLIGIVLEAGKNSIFYTDTSAFAPFKPGEKIPSAAHNRHDDGILKQL